MLRKLVEHNAPTHCQSNSASPLGRAGHHTTGVDDGAMVTRDLPPRVMERMHVVVATLHSSVSMVTSVAVADLLASKTAPTT